MSNVLLDKLRLIEQKHPDETILFLFDSLDQLNKYDHNLEWLITSIESNNAKIIYSALINYNKKVDKLHMKINNKSNYY